MSKLVRSVFVRLSRAFEIHSPRRSVRLALRLSSTEVISPSKSNEVCVSHSCDISSTGLSFVLPTTRVGDRHIFSGTILRIRLDLPGGEVEMTAMPVRYDAVDGRGNERGYLVGARILDMCDEDRARYFEFMRSPARVTKTLLGTFSLQDR